MKITLDRAALKGALKKAALFARPNSSIAVLSCVMIDAAGDRIILTASDNQCAIRLRLDAQVKEEGRALLDAAQLGRIVDAATAPDVKIDTSKDTARITSGAAVHTVKLRDPEDYPKIEPPQAEGAACIDAEILAGLCRSVAYAISKDVTRPDFTGAALDVTPGLAVMSSTDGHRLATARASEVSGASISGLIPARGVLAMAELTGPVGLSMTGPRLHVETDEAELIINGIAGKFPDFKRVIDIKATTTIKVAARPFAEAIKTAALASPKTGAIRLFMDCQKITISAQTSEAEAWAEVDAVIEGPRQVMGMNWRYLMDAITAAAWPAVTMEIADKETPVILRGGEGAVHVIMPMQL